MIRKNLSSLALALFVSAGLMAGAQQAHAFTLTAKGGMSTMNGSAHAGLDKTALLLGGELTFGLGSLIQFGPFYEYNSIGNSTNSGTLNFFGGVIRVGFIPTRLFADLNGGLVKSSFAGTSSDTSFGFGAGLGYEISIAPLISISPRIGYRNLPSKVGSTETERTSLDGSLLLSVSLL